MIPYIEIIDRYNLKAFAMVEPSECFFELSFDNIGAFEFTCEATPKHLHDLTKGQYVRIPNKRFTWVITSITYEFNADGARMIDVKGYEAKWILSKRIITDNIILNSDLIHNVINLITKNTGDERNLYRFIAPDVFIVPMPETQAVRSNLLDYILSLLNVYHVCIQLSVRAHSAYDNRMYINFTQGRDLSSSVKFSQSLDNLLSCTYLNDDTSKATYIKVINTIEDTDYEAEYNNNPTLTGIDRSEVFLKGNVSTSYIDDDGIERKISPSSAQYTNLAIEAGKTELEKHKTIENVTGEIDLINSSYEFDDDFFIGDIVEIQDEYFNISAKVRIMKYTLSQDNSGYKEEADYQTENNTTNI